MILNRTFLTALLLCYPFMAFGVDVSALKDTMSGKKNINEVISAYQSATEQLLNDEKYKDKVDADAQKEIIVQNIQKAKFELIDSLPDDGVAVLNMDDELQVNYKLKNKHECYNLK